MFVKICGTTNEEDALLSVALGADAVGFIFAASSRQIKPRQAGDIVRRLPADVLTVGVFRNESPKRVIETVMETDVRAVQLHGMESPDDVAELRTALPLIVIKAFSAASREVAVADSYNAQVVLLDAPSPGSGQIFDWRLAAGVPDGVRLMLAGGLHPDNVTEAIEQVHPWGVDVVSGVEAKPGQKDPRKLRDFIRKAKAAVPIKARNSTGTLYDWQEDL